MKMEFRVSKPKVGLWCGIVATLFLGTWWFSEAVLALIPEQIKQTEAQYGNAEKLRLLLNL